MNENLTETRGICYVFKFGDLSRVLGLKFKVGKVLEKVLGPDPRIRILMAFPIGREVLGLKFDASG